jgi:hypothetical protein
MGDSGQHGAYGLLDPETGATLEQGSLPLGAAGDDLEGLAVRHGLLYGLSSAGWIRSWKRDDTAHGFALVDDAYAIGPQTLSDKGGRGDRPATGDGMACGAMRVNCGRNYEGLALSEDAQQGDACIGVALSKADGVLYCLTEENGKLVGHQDRALHVGEPGQVADCALALDDPDTLWIGDNLFGGNAVSRVTGWRDLAHAKIEEVGLYGVGFSEGLAVNGDTLYRLSDMGGTPSLMAKFRCAPPAR